METDIIIIGGGLVGSMTYHYFKSRGLSATIFDSSEPMAASKCSFGVWKDGWINESIKPFVERGMPFMVDLLGDIGEVEFIDMKKEQEVKMNYVDCSRIIVNNEDVIPAKVKYVIRKTVFFLIDGKEYALEAKKAVIIAAGAYTDNLLNLFGLKNKHNLSTYWGATLEVEMNIGESRIKEWAPYKQNVLLKKNEKNFVFGDGASVKNPSTVDKRIEMVSSRLITHLNETAGGNISTDKITSVKEGWRPYLPKGDKEYVKQHDKNIFSATGGAKNTTILCPFIAMKLFEKIILQK